MAASLSQLGPPYDLTASITEQALEAADPFALALAVVQVTGDLELLSSLEEAAQSGAKACPDVLAAAAREHAKAVLRRVEAGETVRSVVDRPTLDRMVRSGTGYPSGDAHVPMLVEQAALDGAGWSAGTPPAKHDATRRRGPVAIIGAGGSGLLAGIALQRAGIPFVILEKNEAVGGTWHENTYPGCGVDTPSFFYSYSFDLNPPWSRYFARRDEIAAYFERSVDAHHLRDSIRFRTEVVSAAYDQEAAAWAITTRGADGRTDTLAAFALIIAVGQLNRPAIPSIPGLDTFAGPVVHTARWPHGLDLSGKRVAMIGTGASGMQVGPALAPAATSLTIYQRSPHWVLPNPVYHKEIDAAERYLLDRMPFYANWVRARMIWNYGDAVYPALQVDPAWPHPDRSLNELNDRHRRAMTRHLEAELAGRPDLIQKALPHYPPYGKRVLLDNHWFKTLRRENVELVAGRVRSVEPGGIVDADGAFRPADAIVLATGFEASRMLWSVEVRGRNGLRLREVWGEDNPRAYLGITVPRFPNLFLINGPNTNLAFGGSALFHSEAQVGYAVGCIRAMLERDWVSLDCRADVHDAYNAQVDAQHAIMVWARPGVSNWYKNKAGRVTQNSPWRMVDYWQMLRTPNFDDFIIESAEGSRVSSRAVA
jgi:4-hydroxyacetophenone monooxygenase